MRVVLKLLAEETPTPERLGRFRREFEIAAQLRAAGIVQPLALDRLSRTPALVMPDHGAQSCDKLLSDGPMAPATAVGIGLGIARILGDVHGQGVVHKDISPGNILYDPASSAVRLIDFGLASEIRREDMEALPASALEGTLAYIAPEQTGRMNRGLDFRADFYSLGATLVEFLTGRPPFTAADALTLVHSHLAVQPPAAQDRNPDVPQALDAVLARMLAKTPEERYQSAAALVADLQRCYDALSQGKPLPAFTPGRGDIPLTLQIPQKLYGRRDQIAALQAGFDAAVAGQRALTLVAGDPGIGKSALVRELHRPATGAGAFFLAGKFEQLGADQPYSAIVAALQGLLRQLLAESEADLAAWSDHLANAMGGNLAVLAQVLPGIADIVGPQDPPPRLDPEAERNRFHLTLAQFLAAIAGADHPLVIFLDDLQWADAASLSLLRALLTDTDIAYIQVIAAYRPSEVDAAHPVTTLADAVAASGGASDHLQLAGLTEDDVGRFIADSLWTTPEACAALTAEAYRKTLGNPFFLERLLAHWYSHGLLWPDTQAGYWQWDGPGVAASAVADNVVALMTEKLAALPDETMAVVPLAAVMGASFDLAKLAVVAEETPQQVLTQLWPAIEADILRPIDDAYKYVGTPGHSGHARLRFLHDKVQQAALESLSGEAETRTRLVVGRLLLAEIDSPETDATLFEALGHLNAVAQEITDATERQRLAQLNATAARRARQAVAYDRQRQFVCSGLALLGDTPWQQAYDTWLALQNLGAEAALVANDFAGLEAISRDVLAHARDVTATVPVRRLRVLAYIQNDQPGNALSDGVASLAALGVNVPRWPSLGRVLASYAVTRRVVARHTPEAQLARGPIQDARRAAMVTLMASLVPPAVIAGSRAYMLLVFRITRELWRSGNHPAGTFAFTALGATTIALGEPVADARRFADLGEKLLGQLDARSYQGMMDLTRIHRIAPWEATYDTLLDDVRNACEAARAHGDHHYGGLLACFYVFYLWFSDRPLDASHAEAQRYLAWVNQLWGSGHGIAAAADVMGHLYHGVSDPLRLPSLGEAEEACIQRLEASGHSGSLYPISLAKLELAVHYRRFEALDIWLHRLHVHETSMRATPLALRGAAVALWADGARHGPAHPRTRTERWRLRRHLAALEKALARIPEPASYRSWVALARAEVKQSLGRAWAAQQAYADAIAAATAQSQRVISGLARERMADHLMAHGQPILARPYLLEAQADYAAVAAYGKLAFLERHYGLLPPGRTSAGGSQEGSQPSLTVDRAQTRAPETTRPESQGANDLDLAAVVRAAETISREIRPEALVEQLMRTVAHTAGATDGCLLLFEQAGQHRLTDLRVWARLAVDAATDVAVLDGTPMSDEAQAAPAQVLRYVLRTRQLVVLDEPAKRSDYSNDAYLRQHEPGSLLALPLVNQGRLSGLLYLEHRTSPGAFPQARTNVLSLLSAQMAIAIENARLYATMEEKVAQRTWELEAEKTETERAHRVIQDSLENARRMQRAALPQASAAQLGLADLAIWWQPREHVGGDFYRLTASEDGRYLAVVLMDCTGHGVPGALISFIATSAADRTLAHASRWEPAELLYSLDALVRQELHGTRDSDVADDGLEAGIAVIDRRTGDVAYAGAGIHLFRDGADGIGLIRGARGALGYRSLPPPADMTTTHLGGQAGCDLVMTTDGILEQTGGPKGLQLGRRRFARLLKDTRGAAALGERLNRIEQAFQGWRSDEPQRDDLTLIALRPAHPATER